MTVEQSRRDFIKTLGFAAFWTAIPSTTFSIPTPPDPPKDIIYFAEDSYRLPDGSHLRLTSSQRDYLRRLSSTEFMLTKKSRCSGATTMNIVYSLWRCCCFDCQTVIYRTSTLRQSTEFQRYAYMSAKQLDTLAYEDENMIVFTNGNKLIFTDQSSHTNYTASENLLSVVIDDIRSEKALIPILPFVDNTHVSITFNPTSESSNLNELYVALDNLFNGNNTYTLKG